MRDVLLTGKAGAGKDTFADFLETHGYKRIALAASLKEIAAIVDPEIMADKVMTPDKRRMLQLLGDVLRTYDRDVFCRIARYRIGALRPSPIVVTDGRYSNEFEYFCGHVHRFACLRIETPDEIRFARLEKRDGVRPNSAAMAHPSENDLARRQGVLIFDNSGSLDAMQAAAFAFAVGRFS